MISINLSNFAISKIENANYLCIITEVSKVEDLNLIQNIDLIEKLEHYKYGKQFSSYKFSRNSNCFL